MGITGDFSAWAESERGKEFLMEMSKGLDRKIEKAKSEHEKIEKLSNEEFDLHINKLSDKSPLPASLLFDVADHYGEPYTDALDEFDVKFGTGSVTYRNHIFNWVNGQGTILRIFKDEPEGPKQLLCI